MKRWRRVWFATLSLLLVVGSPASTSLGGSSEAPPLREALEVSEPRRLSCRWSSAGQGDAPHATIVTWTLAEAEPGVTRVQLVQSGFRSEAKQEIGGARHSWMPMIEPMRGLLATA